MESLRRAICAAAALTLFAVQAQALTLNNGLTGTQNFTVNLNQAGSSSSMSFGGWGSQVFAWDMYINVGGTVTRLGDAGEWHSVEAFNSTHFAYESVTRPGLTVDVMAQLPNASNVLETSYTISNMGSTAISNIRTYQYLDPDLAGTAGGDYASTTTLGGETMMVAHDPTAPASSVGLVNGGTYGGLLFTGWEIDRYSVLRNNILSGTYDLSNSISYAGNPFDVTMALEYQIASLGAHQSATISTELVANPVPEPGTMLLLGAGFLGLAIYGKRRKNA